ncbi:MAG: InlB B-repeat-containing protein [Clostridiales Family XIII bacterium]|jgi:uncharacterized repeat protein (TIGR02543 family)|nr:InlB B-repeat-containing protein [Clostridiales Family XIII bacterium]
MQHTHRIARGRILAFLITFALALACVVPAGMSAGGSAVYATSAKETPSEWPSFRGDPATKGITEAPTAKTAGDAKKNWEYRFRKDGGLIAAGPLLIGDRIYLAISDTADYMTPPSKLRIVALNKKGQVVKSVSVTGANGTNTGLPIAAQSIGYGGGNIYVPLTDGTICAYDAKTLKFKWRSARIAEGADVISSITYKDGYIYSGASTGMADSGCFFALNAKNGRVAWKYGQKGYYCAGAAFTDKAVFFAGEDGILVSHALKSAKTYDSYKLDGAVRCETVISGSTLYVTTKEGKLYKVPVAKNGKTFTDKDVKSATLYGPQCTSEPIVYNNKVYTFSAEAAFGGTSTLEVWNAKTLARKSSVDAGAYIQDQPLLTTAYAHKGNGYKVYLYVLQNDAKDDVLVITDSAKMAKPSVGKLYSPGGDYALASPIAAKDGTLYFYHSVTNPTDWSTDARLVSLGNAAKKYTVKFNANGGKVSTKSLKLYSGAKYGKLPAPTRKGYKFKGWYTKKSGGVKISAGSTVKIKKAATLYARWSRK